MSLTNRAWSAARQGFVPLAVVALLATLIYSRTAAPVPVRVALVERGPVVEQAFGRGTIESEREAALGFDMVGRVSDVLVEEGARVTLGQELARLETSQAEADLRAARTGVAAARSSLQRLAAEEERSRTLLGAAEREAKRAQSLFEAGALPAQQRDDVNDKLRLARADLDRVLAQRAEATRTIDVASSGADQRQVAVLRATLLAPFDGLVTRRLREPGDTVTVGTTILRVVDTSQVYVRASLDETVLPNLAEDQQAEVLFPRALAPLSAKVTRVAWEADRQTHEIFVDVALDKPERRVAMGQRADVRVELARRADALRVPLSALAHDGEGAFVHVDRGGRIGVARPRFGLTGERVVEVLEGLEEGDRLLLPIQSGDPLPVGRRWRSP